MAIRTSFANSSSSSKSLYSAPFALFAKTPVSPLTPRRLERFAGRISRLQNRMSESRLEITMTPTTEFSPVLSPLTLEQHDSLSPQRKIVTIGDDEFDLESEHDSLPSLHDYVPSFSTVTNTTANTTPAQTPLQISVSSPQRQQRIGVFPSSKVLGNDAPLGKLPLENTPSNWERCQFSAADGRKVSMLEISRERLTASAPLSNSSQVVDTIASARNDSGAYLSRQMSQLSILVPEPADVDYDLSDVSIEDSGFVMVDPELQKSVRREAMNSKPSLKTKEEADESLLTRAVLVPFPAEGPKSWFAPSNSGHSALEPSVDRPHLSQRSSRTASLDRSQKHMRNRLDNILNEFDSHIQCLIQNAESNAKSIREEHQNRLFNRGSR